MNRGPIIFDDDDDEIAPTPSTSLQVPFRADNIDQHSIAHVFLSVHQFLEQQNCPDTAQSLREELDRRGLLPTRLDPFDETGERRIRNTFSRYQRTNSNITDLLPLVSRLYQYAESTFPLANSLKAVRLTQNVPQFSITRLTNATEVQESDDPEFFEPELDDMTTRDMLRAIKFGRIVPTDHSLLSRELKTNIKPYTKVMGHISPIYCVVFDRTGEYIITGADDNLIKVWDARQCLLRYTYRGHFGEISDLAVSLDNCLLVSGSNDKTVRIWSLQDGSTRKVFMKHKGSITSVMFPTFFEGNTRYLISTALDCSICFYRFDAKSFEFEKDVYHFKHKDNGPGKIITACSSAGGKFAAFSDTRKNIFVYRLTADNVELISTMKTPHSRPDSLMWANTSMKLLSGGSDGVLKCWEFQCNMWRCKEMKLPESELSKLVAHQPHHSMSRKNNYSVLTMTWSLDDTYIITTGTDNVVRVWDARKLELAASLKGHDKTVFVIRNHPTDPRYMVTAAHDGLIILWDLKTFLPVKKIYNDSIAIPGRNDPILDLCFSFNGLFCSFVDDTGFITFMGIGSNEEAKNVPKQQFFHNDYLPCVNNDQNYTIDVHTELPPHLNNPPTFIQMEGIPHADEWQRKIPGRAEYLDSPASSAPLQNEGAFCAWKTLHIIGKLGEEQLTESKDHALFMAEEFDKLYNTERVKIPPKSWIESPKPKRIKRAEQMPTIDPQVLPPNFDESDSDDATYSEGSGRSRSQTDNEVDNVLGGVLDEEVDEDDSDYYEGYHGHDTVFRVHNRRRRRRRDQQENDNVPSPDSVQENAEHRPRRVRREPRILNIENEGSPRRRRNRHTISRPNTRANPAPEPEELPAPRPPRSSNPPRRQRQVSREFGMLSRRRSERRHQFVDYVAMEAGDEEEIIPHRSQRTTRRALVHHQPRSTERDEETQDVPGPSSLPSTASSQILSNQAVEQEDLEQFEDFAEDLSEEEIESTLQDDFEEEQAEEQDVAEDLVEVYVQQEFVAVQNIVDPESPESAHEQDSDYDGGEVEQEPPLSDEENIHVDVDDRPSTISESTAVSTDYSPRGSPSVRRSTRKRKKRKVSLSSEDEDQPRRKTRRKEQQATAAASRPRREAAQRRNYADSEDEYEPPVTTTRSGRETKVNRRFR